MTQELIEQTFKVAADVICRMWNEKQIDATEAQVRLERARKICARENLKALDLSVDPATTNQNDH